MKTRIFLAALSLCLVASASLAKGPDIEKMVKRQTLIRQALIDIAAGIEPKTPVEKNIRTVLYNLAAMESMQAVKALEDLKRLQNQAHVRARVDALGKSQDRVINALRGILGIMDKIESKARGEEKRDPGGDLEDDADEAMKKLKEEMDKFAKEQKKILDSKSSIAKRSADDFTPEQEEKLKQLDAAEDKWEKFLQDTRSDLSKMQVQDFSNPAMLDELVETFSEVKMAKDALAEAAKEIATPAEEAGLESATSIETNIEKWLSDKPDRQRWQMEEPLQDFQTPMAELPQELEDIVGELMEQEEDLMSDVEDATSAWNDSIDKGAGWDAMDGPISSMTAKGVTGNRLPNTSEIGGRSGEGRTGKSAGEFVEKTATGKGGRRTPTRLTPDPFEKGVVDDKSKDSGGGSTGGGKVSGGGAEGLEGPPPPELNQQMKALAGRQAELRNRAERVALNFRVMNFPTNSVDRVIKHMRGLEGKLRSGRYVNMPRERKVLLRSLKDAMSVARGKARVTRDITRVGARQTDDITESPGERAPKGYEDLIGAYYQVLNKTQ